MRRRSRTLLARQRKTIICALDPPASRRRALGAFARRKQRADRLELATFSLKAL
jgi:hypothetical protein